ncbi:YeeE/YedE family protein [Rhodovulum sp. DZ06]|uniref:YeeE/YedE family protein n=1 Tax=Rhodovulum sp. DZ06 TaxID=3425126 RepID=UPI003D33AD68
MDLEPIIELVGEPATAALGGLVLGAVFGAAAQRSQFCLRASAVEFARGRLGPRMAVWLLTFSTALFWTQLFVNMDVLNLSEARMLAQPGSISGAVIGGLMFGGGMVLARGCSGRLLVLSATGNLRALIAGLVFAAVAQMSLRGALAPAREAIAGLWITGGSNIELSGALGLGPRAGLLFGVLFAGVALVIAAKNKVSWMTLLGGSGVGFTVAAGWWFTQTLSYQAFDPVQVESLTFSGPSADTLMWFLTPEPELDFDVGLVPGVALGAAVSALLARQWQWQGFDQSHGMPRYLIGAAMMGFGAMLAGGCAIGAGVTGGSALALTAWVALTCMWLGAVAADRLVDRGGAPAPAPAAAPAE